MSEEKLIGLDEARRRIRPAAQDGPTEDGAALEFERRFTGKLLFDHDAGAWFEWTGHRWKREGTARAFHWCRETARQLAGNAKGKSQATALRASFASGVERFARSTPAFAVTSAAWDSDDYNLGTPGGTVDLETGKTKPADPGDRITKMVAVAPADTADCPRWRRFLSEATGGDVALIRFLQQIAGYALSGDTREHALFFLHGAGGNGKSVLVNVLTGILGDYATTASMDTFTASNASKHPTDLAMLRGARLVTASETEEGKSWAEARIKQLTGGDPITARFMRQDFFTFTPIFKLFIVGNHRPTLANVDEALRRRLNFIPFENKPAKPDPSLEHRLFKEWPGILRWMIEGYLDWQKHGLVRPPIVISATDGYFADQDLLGQWLDECCDTEPGNMSKWDRSADLFASWRSYAENAGERVSAAKSFAEALQKRGFVCRKGTKGVRTFRGIRLKQEGAHHAAA